VVGEVKTRITPTTLVTKSVGVGEIYTRVESIVVESKWAGAESMVVESRWAGAESMGFESTTHKFMSRVLQ
jgi:hypothetical protein